MYSGYQKQHNQTNNNKKKWKAIDSLVQLVLPSLTPSGYISLWRSGKDWDDWSKKATLSYGAKNLQAWKTCLKKSCAGLVLWLLSEYLPL